MVCPWCRAGHPCSTTAFPDDVVEGAPDHTDAPPARAEPVTRSQRPLSSTRRATELLRQAMASEDADEVGLRAEHVLADGGTALALLGRRRCLARGPRRGRPALRKGRRTARPRVRGTGADARSRFGDRSPRLAQRIAPVAPRRSHNGSHNGSVTGSHNGSHNGSQNDDRRDAERLDDGMRHIERLVRDFADLDALGLYRLLCEIDHDEGFGGDEDGVDAHRWLHATYAVAARDGTPGAHRAYMLALDRVMRLVRPLVAS